MKRLLFLAVGCAPLTGCIAVSAHDNQLYAARQREAVVVNDRLFLVNLRDGAVAELRLPGPGETSVADVQRMNDEEDAERRNKRKQRD